MADKKKTLTAVFKIEDKMSKPMHSIAEAGEKATKSVKSLKTATAAKMSISGAETCAQGLIRCFREAEGASTKSINEIADAIEKEFRDSAKTTAELVLKVNNLEKELTESKDKVNALEAEIAELNKTTDDTDEKFKGMGDSLSGVTDLVKGFIAAAGAYMGVSAITTGINNELKAVNQFKARVGASTAEMEKYKTSIDNLYRNGMGESLEDTVNSMATVKTSTGLIGEELEKATNNAILFRDTFEFDPTESTRSVKMMMDQFNVSADTAYNLIAQGAQNGLDKNGDLLDTINEYSVHFQQLGFDAEDMFNMLVNGSASGTFSVDKLGDSIKEFGIRVIDGSDTTKTGFQAIGLNADTMAMKFAKGGNSAREAFNQTINELKDMTDPIAQNTAGVNLFGTMWEDLGSKGVIALSDVSGKISETSTALEDINDIKYQDLGSTLTTVSRSLMGSLVDGASGHTDEIIAEFKEMQTKLEPVFESIGDSIGDFIEDVPDMLEKAGTAVEFLEKHATTTKTVLGGIVGIVTAKKTIKGITNFADGMGTALKTTSFLSSTTTKAGGALATFAGGLSGVALPLTVATGAITAGVVAFKTWEEHAKDKSLEEHFGNITLSMNEMENIADKLVTGGNLTKLQNSLKEFEKLDTAEETIEGISSELVKTEWKTEVGIEIADSEKESYKTSISNYISEMQSYAEQQHYTATLSVEMLFGENSTGDELINQFNEFHTNKETELQSCAKNLQETVNEAFKDGLLTFDESEKIRELRKQMAEIQKGIAEGETEVSLHRINLDYSAKGLTLDTFNQMSGEIDEVVDKANDAYAAYYQTTVSGIKESSKDKATKDRLLAEAESSYVSARGANIARGAQAKSKGIYDAYSAELNTSYTAYSDYTSGKIFKGQMNNAINEYNESVKQGLSGQAVLTEFQRTAMNEIYNSMVKNVSSGDRKAVSELYENLKPTQEELSSVAMDAIKAGQAVPEGVASGILDNAKIGAISNDQSSLYTLMAYNASKENPVYARLLVQAKQSGEYVPDEMMLGIALASPNLIGQMKNTAQSTIDTATSTMKSSETAVKTSAEGVVNSAKNGVESATPGLYSSGQSAGKTVGDGLVQGLSSKLPLVLQEANKFAANLTAALGVQAKVTRSDGSTSVFAIEAHKLNPITPAFSATGGIFDSPTLTWVAEAGDSEAIIPLNDTQRAYDLWQEAGLQIGKARGVGNTVPNTSINMSAVSSNEKTIVLKLEGGGEIKIPRALSKNDVLGMLSENIKPILLNIISQEMFEEGDEAYDT